MTTLEDVRVDLLFDEASVECAEDELIWVRRAFDRHEHLDPARQAEAAQIVADMPSDSDGMHRYLLALRRKHGKWSPFDLSIKHALDAVRPHSRLYTPRKCPCLREAWRAAEGRFAALLPDVAGTYTVTSGGTWYADLERPATLRDFTEYTGLHRYSTQIPRRVEVTGTLADLTLTFGRGRNAATRTFTLLPPRLAQLARQARWQPNSGYAAAGSWVRTWPMPMVDLFEAWVRRGGGYGTLYAKALLEAGAGQLDARELRLALRLTEGWAGNSPEDAAHIVTTARAWTAAHPASLIDVLDYWLEALEHGFDRHVAADAAVELAAAGAGDLTERAVSVTQRLLEDWTGTSRELVVTAAAIAEDGEGSAVA